jgi:D-amino-acid oxidase
MLEELQQAADVDVDVETGVEYESVEALVDEAKLLDCTGGVINCTGLGAKRLLPDDPLVAARGILHHYDRKTCVRRSNVDGVNDATILTEDAPWGSEERPCYLIVRGDTIVVGGSYLEGDLEPTIRDEERQQLLQNAELLGIDTQQSKPIGEWTGFRPYRPTSRCELDAQYNGVDNEVRLVHSYGYGGSGWTVYVGCAKEATELILG